MTPYDWYTRAKERIEHFLPSLDKNLEVYVDTDVITPNDRGAEYTTFMLAFSHSYNPNLHWTMEIEMNDDYIEYKLEQIVTNIYLARVE
jgi:hypothetical protein